MSRAGIYLTAAGTATLVGNAADLGALGTALFAVFILVCVWDWRAITKPIQPYETSNGNISAAMRAILDDPGAREQLSRALTDGEGTVTLRGETFEVKLK